MSIGHKGMVYAAKAMAMTMADLFEKPELVAKVKAEYKDHKGDEVYEAIIPDGPPPIDNK
jgi:aminobenzoyl-glutamate utilization protein B